MTDVQMISEYGKEWNRFTKAAKTLDSLCDQINRTLVNNNDSGYGIYMYIYIYKCVCVFIYICCINEAYIFQLSSAELIIIIFLSRMTQLEQCVSSSFVFVRRKM